MPLNSFFLALTNLSSRSMRWYSQPVALTRSDSHGLSSAVVFLKSLRVHLDLRVLRLVAVRLPMPLRMQLRVHLAPCLFLMYAHASSYSHQDRSTHALFSLQAALLLRHVFLVHPSEVRSKAFYSVQSCFHCPHLIFVLEEL
jgi:hypothetical protein